MTLKRFALIAASIFFIAVIAYASPLPINQAPQLDRLGTRFAVINSEFYHDIDAYDPDSELTFSDNTDLFDINSETGEIEFNPAKEQIGVYQIEITASDGQLSTSETLTLAVVEKLPTSTVTGIVEVSVIKSKSPTGLLSLNPVKSTVVAAISLLIISGLVVFFYRKRA